MNSSEEIAKPYTADRRQIWAWGVGGITNHTLIMTFGQVTNIFILGFGLSPILVGWVMSLPRFLDGIVDPFIGHLSDNTHTPWGRRKPFMVFGAISAAVLLAATWQVDRSWSRTVQFVYLLVCCTLFYTCWGIYAMAWAAMGYELTDDYHERSRIQGIAGIFLTAMALLNSWLYWLILRPVFGTGHGAPYKHTGIAGAWEFLTRQVHGDPAIKANEVTGIHWLGSGIAIMAVVAAIVCVVTCRERFVNANPSPEKGHVPLWPALKATMRNRPFVILLLYRAVGLFSTRLFGLVGGTLTIYYVCGGNKDVSFRVAALGGTFAMVFGFALMPFMGWFSKRMGKRQAMRMGALVSLIAALIAPLVTIPGHPYLPMVVGLTFVPLGIIANTLGDALLPDICDYDELLSGQRREGLFTSVLAFFSKMEMSVGALGGGYLLSWTGFHKDLAMQSTLTLNRMWWMTMMPAIVSAIICLFIVVRFPLTEAMMAEVRRKLDARHAARPLIGDESAQSDDHRIGHGLVLGAPAPLIWTQTADVLDQDA